MEDPSCLQWAKRVPQIVEEIKNCAPDIFCLQEANHSSDVLSPTFPEFAMLLAPKLNSAALSLGGAPPDACAIFIKRDRFAIRGVKIHFFQDPSGDISNQNAIFACLSDLQASGKQIIVISEYLHFTKVFYVLFYLLLTHSLTHSLARLFLLISSSIYCNYVFAAAAHLKAKGGEVCRAQREHQVKQLLVELDDFIGKYGAHPVVICGDFNGDPSEALYASMLSSPLDFCSAYNSFTRKYCREACGGEEAEASCMYASGEPEFTTWKFRDNGKVREFRCLQKQRKIIKKWIEIFK